MAFSAKVEDHSVEVIAAKDSAIQAALEMMGLQCENYTKLLCPVDTGRLRNSYTHDVRTGEEAVYIGTNVEYAPYVEYGTSRMDAQPHLKPAVEDHTAEYQKIAQTCLATMK